MTFYYVSELLLEKLWTLLEHQQYLPSREGSNWNHFLFFSPNFPRRQHSGLRGTELTQSVQVLPGDLTPLSPTSHGQGVCRFQARKWRGGLE